MKIIKVNSGVEASTVLGVRWEKIYGLFTLEEPLRNQSIALLEKDFRIFHNLKYIRDLSVNR